MCKAHPQWFLQTSFQIFSQFFYSLLLLADSYCIRLLFCQFLPYLYKRNFSSWLTLILNIVLFSDGYFQLHPEEPYHASIITCFYETFVMNTKSQSFLPLFMYVFAITATPFILELSKFSITFLVWISKKAFLNFLKNCFFPELLPFFYISLRFLCNFEDQLRKNQWR